MASAAAVSVAAVALVAAGVADATGPPPPPPPCSFTVSPPARAGDSVTATVQSVGCAPLAAPYFAVACLQPGGGTIRCEQAHGADPAQVSVPYVPGVTFVATGRGCAGWAGLPSAPDCQELTSDSVAP